MANYNSVQELLDAGTTNMTVLVDNVGHDDDSVIITDIPTWILFNGSNSTAMYANGNSYLGIINSGEQLRVNRRDAKMWYLYREMGTLYNYYNFFKIRWRGYTIYNSTSDICLLEYDVIFWSTGDISLHMVNIPTSSYAGTFNLTASSVTTYTAPTVESPDVTFRTQNENNSVYVAENVLIDLAAPYDRKYLVKSDSKLYNVVDGAFNEVPSPGGGDTPIPMSGSTTAWVSGAVNTSGTLKRTDDNAKGYVYPIVAGQKYTITCLATPDRLRIATSAIDPMTIEANGSIATSRILYVNDAPSAGYTHQFVANANENFLYLHISANGQDYPIDVKIHPDELFFSDVADDWYGGTFNGSIMSYKAASNRIYYVNNKPLDGITPFEVVGDVGNLLQVCAYSVSESGTFLAQTGWKNVPFTFSTVAGTVQLAYIARFSNNGALTPETAFDGTVDIQVNALGPVPSTGSLADTFAQLGNDDPPDKVLLTTLPDPIVMYWNDTETYEIPIPNASETAVPFAQTLYSPDYDMTDPSINGIEKVISVASENISFAMSLDSGTTWYMWTGTAWGVLSETDTGMSSEVLNSITTEQWALLPQTGKFRFRITIPTETEYFTSLIVDYIN